MCKHSLAEGKMIGNCIQWEWHTVYEFIVYVYNLNKIVYEYKIVYEIVYKYI